MAHRRSSSIPLVIGAIALAAAIVSPVLAAATVPRSSSNKGSIDTCVVLPGFATPPASISIHTTGPKNFDRTASFQASACGSHAQVPSGQYTLVQSDTAPGFHLAQINCFLAGFADHSVGNVDLASASVTIKVSHPTVCLFAELPGGGGSGGSGNGGGGGGGGTQGSGTPTQKNGTSTTSASTTTTTKPALPSVPATVCVQNPDYPPKLPQYFCTGSRVG